MSIIKKAFSGLLIFLYEFVGNYGIALILFALVVRLVLLPFQMKSKRSMMRTTRMQPKMNEIQKKYANDPQKQQQEMSKFYKEHGINPMSGCLWSLIPFPIMIALYSVIRTPLSTMMQLSAEQIGKIETTLTNLGAYVAPEKVSAYYEIELTDLTHQFFDKVSAVVPEVMDIDFSFIGLNLGQQPEWNFFMHVDWSQVSSWLPALGLFFIPIVSSALTFLQSKISAKTNPAGEQQQTMNGMMMMMPVMSLVFCFIMPAALGLYWIAGSALSIIQDIVLNKHYGKILDAEDAGWRELEAAKEAELEKKREETERLRAEGATKQNKSTSKKKQQNLEKAKSEERAAKLNAERRAAEGIPDSQEGTRRYARGRAYVTDRYDNPEEAEENTRLAAQESEGAESIAPDDIQDALLIEENIQSSQEGDSEVVELEDESDDTFSESDNEANNQTDDDDD